VRLTTIVPTISVVPCAALRPAVDFLGANPDGGFNTQVLRLMEMRIDVLWAHRRLHRGPKIVALAVDGTINIAGGLKTYSANITAIVTVADDGGSSGGCGGKWSAAAGRYSAMFGGTGR